MIFYLFFEFELVFGFEVYWLKERFGFFEEEIYDIIVSVCSINFFSFLGYIEVRGLFILNNVGYRVGIDVEI